MTSVKITSELNFAFSAVAPRYITVILPLCTVLSPTTTEARSSEERRLFWGCASFTLPSLTERRATTPVLHQTPANKRFNPPVDSATHSLKDTAIFVSFPGGIESGESGCRVSISTAEKTNTEGPQPTSRSRTVPPVPFPSVPPSCSIFIRRLYHLGCRRVLRYLVCCGIRVRHRDRLGGQTGRPVCACDIIDSTGSR